MRQQKQQISQIDTKYISRVRRSLFGLLAMVLLFTATLVPVAACPFCSAPQLTLAEQISQNDVCLFGQWVSGVKSNFDAGTPGHTVFRVDHIIKAGENELAFQIDQEVIIDQYYPEIAGASFLLVGRWDGKIAWLSPLEIQQKSLEYIKNLPSPEEDSAKRLHYFLKYLEAGDPLVADDAYAEFANAPYATIAAIKDQFSREKIRHWVFSDQTQVTRLGLYGLMLGLCGEAADIPAMKEKVVRNDVDFRLGIDGIMGGYLLLAGEAGLVELENSKFKPSLQSPCPVPFSETFSAMQALKFAWEYAPETVPPERLRQSMRILLEHPDMADLVIIDLARWEDWSLLPRLKVMYNQAPFDVPAVKRSIVGYLIQCIKQKPAAEDAPVPPFVTEAEAYLAELEESDPKTVRTARLIFR